jgi:hypothetical protein
MFVMDCALAPAIPTRSVKAAIAILPCMSSNPTDGLVLGQ